MAMLFSSGNRPPTIGRRWCCGFVPVRRRAAESTVEFNRDIRPLLSDRCFACHGPDANHREAELRLDVESSAKESVIVAGDLAGSELWQRISSEDPEQRMPPPDSGKQLTASRDRAVAALVGTGSGLARSLGVRADPPSAVADDGA